MKTTFQFGPSDPNWGQQIQMALSKIQPRFKVELADPGSHESQLLGTVCTGNFGLDDIKALHTHAETIGSRVRDHFDKAEYPEHMKEAAIDDARSAVNTVFDAYTYVHEHIQKPVTAPKTLAAVLILATLLAGCTTVTVPVNQEQPKKKSLWFSTPFSLVNNSGYILDVYQNGEMIRDGLAVGDVLAIRQSLTLALNFTVIVVGHTETGEYVGSSTWYYRNGYPEVWSVSHLNKPQPPR